MVSSAERCVALLFFCHSFDQYFYLQFLDLDRAWVSAGLPSSNYAEYFVSGGFFDPESRRFLSPSVLLKHWGALSGLRLRSCCYVSLSVSHCLFSSNAVIVSSGRWRCFFFVWFRSGLVFDTGRCLAADVRAPRVLNSMLLALDVIDKPTRVLLYSNLGIPQR
ncbi:MAG: hypothetical protein CM1200mP41_22640 [Gammaproteobacteria bacterium]|nr:MAG: hypothetical protein CM1200mP41_22640 [Gammaproteobacteria bacterium]